MRAELKVTVRKMCGPHWGSAVRSRGRVGGMPGIVVGHSQQQMLWPEGD